MFTAGESSVFVRPQYIIWVWPQNSLCPAQGVATIQYYTMWFKNV